MLGRAEAIEAVAGRHFEVLVIGGGVTGAGVALDAASRGYSVALLEGRDYAIGTSSRSSKMVHGGLRYLQNFDLGLVREALLERQLMVDLAPHLVYPTPYLVPTLADEKRDRKIGIGLNMYDVMASSRGRRPEPERRSMRRRPAEAEGAWSPDRHRMIDGEAVAGMVPALAGRDPESAYLFYDCQTDDARLVLTILAEAHRFGAVSLNRARVDRVIERDGRASGVAFTDGVSGQSVEVGADNVVNATGVWADRIRPGEIESEEDVPRISPSRGSHIIFARESIDMGEAACVIPAGEGRSIFALPWYGRTLVGTTDTDHHGEFEHVSPEGEDIGYMLDAVNGFMGTSLGDSDIVGAYAGVRPLISSGDPRKSVDISRRAELYETSSGMLTITGGKLTTWRRMARQTVDRMVEREGREAPCRTDEIPLGMEASREDLEAPDGVSSESLDQLAFRYGHVARDVLELAFADPPLAEPILPGHPDLLAEVAYAIDNEQAASIDDVLLRRTRLGLLAASELRSTEDVRAVAEVMKPRLGWSRSEARERSREWLDVARAEGLDPAAGRAAGSA